jgi:hypothetical protein
MAGPGPKTQRKIAEHEGVEGPDECGTRLDDGATTTGQRGSELPGGHEEGEVEGDNLADDAEWLVEVVRDGVLVDLGSRTFECPLLGGELPEVVGR